MADAHAASAAAGCGLDDDGIPDFVCDFDGFIFGFDGTFGAGEDWDFCGFGESFCFDFITEAFHGFGAWADEFDFAVTADFGEVGAFGEEAVAWVNGIDIGNFGCGDDAGDVEVAFACGRGADADSAVGEAKVWRCAIGFGIDADGLDAEFLACADDAKGDLAPICDEDSLEHGCSRVGRSVWANEEEFLSELNGVAVLDEDLLDAA